MKTKFLLFIFLFLMATKNYAQVTFQKVIYTPYGCSGNSVEQTSDSGYIIAGTMKDSSGLYSSAYLVKTDAYGDTLWTKTFSGNDNDGLSAKQTFDGGYILAGNSLKHPSGEKDIYVIKTNEFGDTLWTRNYGGVTYDNGSSILQTSDSGYVIAGTTQSFGAGYVDVYLLKVDPNGNILWSKTYGGAFEDACSSIAQTLDGGFILCGSTQIYNIGQSHYHIYVINTNANGDTLWTRTYGGVDNEIGYSVIRTDSGYVITGFSTSFSAGTNEVYLIKINLNGNILWSKTYASGFDEKGYDVSQTNDGGYIITGFTGTNQVHNGGVYLIKTDANGDTLWSKGYGGNDQDFGKSVRQTKDGGYIIVSSTFSFRNVTVIPDIYFIKTNGDGNSGCFGNSVTTRVRPVASIVSMIPIIVSSGGVVNMTTTVVGSEGHDSTLCQAVGIKELKRDNGFVIYPNPTKEQLNIQLPSSLNNEIIISILNVFGQELYILPCLKRTGDEVIDVSKLPVGIYFLQFKWNFGSVVKSFVKQ